MTTTIMTKDDDDDDDDDDDMLQYEAPMTKWQKINWQVPIFNGDEQKNIDYSLANYSMVIDKYSDEIDNNEDGGDDDDGKWPL